MCIIVDAGGGVEMRRCTHWFCGWAINHLYQIPLQIMGCNGQLFVLQNLSWSRVTSEGVLSEEYIGKYDFCHSDCHVLLHF